MFNSLSSRFWYIKGRFLIVAAISLFTISSIFGITKLEQLGQVSFYMKSGRILKSEVLKEFPTTVRILHKGEEMVLRKDLIQFALDSSGTEVEIKVEDESKDVEEQKLEEKKEEPVIKDENIIEEIEETEETAKELPPEIKESKHLPEPVKKIGLEEDKILPFAAAEDEIDSEKIEENVSSLVSEQLDEAEPEDDILDGVGGGRRVFIQLKNGKVYEGNIDKENKKYYYLRAGDKLHKLNKKNVENVEEIDLKETKDKKDNRIDFYLKNKTIVQGIVVEEKAASFIVESEGKRQELQKKDITFALDENGKDFSVNIDLALLKKLEEDEKQKKKAAVKKIEEEKKKTAIVTKVKKAKEKKQSEKENYYSQGLKQFEEGNYKAAIPLFERVLIADPKLGEAYYRLAFSYYQIGEEELAWKNIDKAKQYGISQAETLLSIMKKDKQRREKRAKIKKILIWGGVGLGGALLVGFFLMFVFRRKDQEFEATSFEKPEFASADSKVEEEPPPKIVSSFEQSKPPESASFAIADESSAADIEAKKTAEVESRYSSVLDGTNTSDSLILPKSESPEMVSPATINQKLTEEPKLEAVSQIDQTKLLQQELSETKEMPLTSNDAAGIIQQEDKKEIPSSGFNPEKAEKNYIKGNDLCNQGNLIGAKIEYENAIRFNPRLDVAYIGLGYVYLSQGKIKEAIREYVKSLDINPNQPEAHYSLGVAYYNNGDVSQARYEWKKALLIDPNFTDAKRCLEEAK
ncbi:MAG: tetratricopeptide repeat protein [bacterium]